MNLGEDSFWDVVDGIRTIAPGYSREAYGFVIAALGVTVQALPQERQSDPLRRHLSGQELVAGMIVLARAEFGLMAPAVFREWGVLTSEDVGRIVFQLVECGQLSARAEDTLEDFRSGPDLMSAVSAVPQQPRFPRVLPGSSADPSSGGPPLEA